jgi:hypothetical protein
MEHSATSMLLLAHAHLGRLGGTRVLTRAVLMAGTVLMEAKYLLRTYRPGRLSR